MNNSASFPTEPSSREVCALADFILSCNPERTMAALWAIAEIIGVVIGLKPVAMISFDMTAEQVREFQKLLNLLGLKLLFEELPVPNLPVGQEAYMFFVSQDLALAEELRAARKDSLELGWCPGNPEDQKLTLEIGRLLGYPKTASEYFAFGPRDERGIIVHRPDYDCDRYYIHSPEHFRAEYEQFEDVLHPAVEHFCPKVASRLRQDETKYWTSADL